MDIESYWKQFQDWDSFSEQCETIDGLTRSEVQRCQAAFSVLKTELGTSFLRRAFKHKLSIVWTVGNQAPWTRKWFTWFAEAIQEVKNFQNYKKLRKKLRNPDQFEEAVSTLEVGYAFSRVGFTGTFEPTIPDPANDKIPDLLVIDNESENTQLYVEIADLYSSKETKESWKTFNVIVTAMTSRLPRTFKHSAQVLKVLSDRHLQHVEKQIIEFVQQVREQADLAVLEIEDVLQFAIAPEDKEEELKNWAKDRELQVNSIQGPNQESDEIRRTKNKLFGEQKQLPKGFPNIIVLKNQDLFIESQGDVHRIVRELEEVIYNHSHIFAAVLCGQFVPARQTNPLAIRQHRFFTRDLMNFSTQGCLILRNKFCETDLPKETALKIERAFLQHWGPGKEIVR